MAGPRRSGDEAQPVEVEVNRRDLRLGDHLARSLHLGRWPRSLAPGFLQGLMTAGAPMDLALHLGSIPADQAARTLEWQKVRFESAQSLSINKGRTLSSEAEIALEDVTRLRDEVQRGRERLFHASLSVTLHAPDEASLNDLTQRAKAHFAATLGKLDALAFRQREGLLSTLPLALNAVAAWRTLDTSSIARLYPLLAARPRHAQRDAGGHRPARLCSRRLRRLRRDPPQRQHRGPCPLRLGEVVRDEAGRAAGPDAGASSPTSSTPRGSTPPWRAQQAGASSHPACLVKG